ncbi:MAG: D-aminoacyl-tRNA deacylase [Pseudomonadota bacterium]
MRILIQRVTDAEILFEGKQVSSIRQGLLVLVCAMRGDQPDDCSRLARKLVRLRIFEDEDGKMNHDLRTIQGEALLVSQFTLGADTSRGNRPGFSASSPPEEALALFKVFTEAVEAEGVAIKTGLFGKTTKIRLVNDGPTTIWIDSRQSG